MGSRPSSSRKRPYPVLLLTQGSSHILPSDVMWPTDSPGAVGGPLGLSQAKGFWTTELGAAGGAWVVVTHSGDQEEAPWVPLWPPPHALSGFLLPLQWLDCSPVHPEAELGCVDHHDGGGWLLHPLHRALPLPPEAGEWWVLGRQQTQEAGSSPLPSLWGCSSLHSGASWVPRGQQLSPRHWVGSSVGWGRSHTASRPRCTPCTAGRGPASSRPSRSFPRASSAAGPSAALPRLLPKEPSRGISADCPPSAPALPLACLLTRTSHGCLTQYVCPARTGTGVLWLFLLSQQPALLFTRGKEREAQGLFYTKEKKVFPSLVVVW